MSSPGTLAILKGGLAAQASASQSHHRRTASASTTSFPEQGAQVQVELQDQGAFAFGSLLGGGTVGAAITRSLAQANAELGHGSQYPRRR
ncbi:unnamed protein product [Symbiodinium sp. KB8]|nr:unnamed protein product [Symbiodinium sp. KB8]